MSKFLTVYTKLSGIYPGLKVYIQGKVQFFTTMKKTNQTVL